MTQPTLVRFRRPTLPRTGMLAGLCVLVMAAAPVFGQQPPAGSSVEQQVVQASNEWFEALMAGDIERLDRLQTDDFLTVQQGRGAVAVVGKAQQMENLRKAGTNRPKFERTLSAVKVRERGSIAILTALATYHQPGPRRDAVISRAVVSEVWVNDQGRWRLWHFQPTDVPATPPR